MPVRREDAYAPLPKKKGADAAAPWWRELEKDIVGKERIASRLCRWAPSGRGYALGDVELPDEPKKIGALQSERAGGVSPVPAVRRQGHDEQLTLKLVNSPLILI